MLNANRIIKVELGKTEENFVQELFGGIAPVGLTKVGTAEGIEIYTSDSLKEKFLDVVKQEKILAPVSEKLVTMTEEKEIIPCYTTSGLIRYLFHKIFGTLTAKTSMALFDPSTNKIYMLFDNRVHFLLWASDKTLSETLLHELQHYASANIKKSFYNLFIPLLSQFYAIFFNELFSTNKIQPKHTIPIIQFLFKEAEWKTVITKETIIRYFRVLKRNFSSFVIDNLDEKITEFLKTIVLFLTNSDRFIDEIASGVECNSMVINNCLMYSYKKLGFRKLDTIAIQETLYPSEVVCMTSMKNPLPEHYQSISLLK